MSAYMFLEYDLSDDVIDVQRAAGNRTNRIDFICGNTRITLHAIEIMKAAFIVANQKYGHTLGQAERQDIINYLKGE